MRLMIMQTWVGSHRFTAWQVACSASRLLRVRTKK